MMKQKRFSLDCLRLTSLFLCDILDYAVIVNCYIPSMGDCGVEHFLALMAKPPFKYFSYGVSFPCRFCTYGEVVTLCSAKAPFVGSNPTTYFWLIGITLVNTKMVVIPTISTLGVTG